MSTIARSSEDRTRLCLPPCICAVLFGTHFPEERKAFTRAVVEYGWATGYFRSPSEEMIVAGKIFFDRWYEDEDH